MIYGCTTTASYILACSTGGKLTIGMGTAWSSFSIVICSLTTSLTTAGQFVKMTSYVLYSRVISLLKAGLAIYPFFVTLTLAFFFKDEQTVCFGIEETDRREAVALFFFSFVTSSIILVCQSKMLSDTSSRLERLDRHEFIICCIAYLLPAPPSCFTPTFIALSCINIVWMLLNYFFKSLISFPNCLCSGATPSLLPSLLYTRANRSNCTNSIRSNTIRIELSAR